MELSRKLLRFKKYFILATTPFPIELEVSPSMQLQNLRYKKRSQRAITKSGILNTHLLHLPQKSRRYFRDLVTTIVHGKTIPVSNNIQIVFQVYLFVFQIDAQWRFVISIHLIALFCCWIIFALFWYLIALSNGDVKFDIDNGIQLNDEPNPCVIGASNVAGFLLFSIELQVGGRTKHAYLIGNKRKQTNLFIIIFRQQLDSVSVSQQRNVLKPSF